MEASTKNCPFCGELIKSDAQKCRYCREWLKDVHEGKSADPAAVVSHIVDEVKTDIPAEISDAQQKTIPISGIVPEKIVSETKTYPSGTIILFDGNKLRSKLKNFYKNRFLPFYQNSYCSFLIMMSIYGFLIGFISKMDWSLEGNYGRELLAMKVLSRQVFMIPSSITFAIMIASGIMFIKNRYDEEKLRKIIHVLILPIVAMVGFITLCFMIAPDMMLQIFLSTSRLPGVSDEVLLGVVRLDALDYFIGAMNLALISLLISTGKFGRLFFSILLPNVVFLILSNIVDWNIYYLPLTKSLIILCMLSSFCRKIIFKNFHFEFDREIIEKFLWTTLCIAVTMYFGNKCCNCYVSCGQMFALSTGRMPLLFVLLNIPFILLEPCIWAGRLADNKQRLGFMLKTLIFAIVYVFVRTLFYYYLCIPSDMQAEWMLTELLNFALLLCPVLLVKAVSNAYYCSCKWFFIIPINMFLSLLGSLAIVQLVFPTVFAKLQKLPLEIHTAVQYSLGFLILSWSIDLLALIHAIINLKKPIRTGRTFYIVSGIISAIIMFGGIWAVNHVQSRIDAVLRAAGELK